MANPPNIETVTVTASKEWGYSVQDTQSSPGGGNPQSVNYKITDKNAALDLGQTNQHDITAETIPSGANLSLRTGGPYGNSVDIHNVMPGANLSLDLNGGPNVAAVQSRGGNVTMRGGNGNDTFIPYVSSNAAPAKGDAAPHFTVDGGGGENTLVVNGSPADYTLQPGREAGHYTVTRNAPDGEIAADYDITNIEHVRSSEAANADKAKRATEPLGSQKASEGIDPASLDYSKGPVHLEQALKPTIETNPKILADIKFENCLHQFDKQGGATPNQFLECRYNPDYKTLADTSHLQHNVPQAKPATKDGVPTPPR